MITILAPMAGVTDLPFRRLAYSFGAPATVTEMIAGEELAEGKDLALSRAAIQPGMGPVIVQIAGREPYWFGEGARLAADLGAEIVDLNFGCPAKKVTGGAGGAALMRSVEHASACISAAVRAVSTPVTVKMRLGWDENTKNAPAIAKAAEDAGAQRVTVHGRTRNQFYAGHADWSAIRTVKDNVTVPIIANGDICSLEDAEAAITASGANGVMVGRGAIGRPWLVGQISDRLADRAVAADPGPERVLSAILGFYDDSLSFYGKELGVRMARKHLAGFIDKQAGLGSTERRRDLRASICTLDDPPLVVRALRDAFFSLTRAAS